MIYGNRAMPLKEVPAKGWGVGLRLRWFVRLCFDWLVKFKRIVSAIVRGVLILLIGNWILQLIPMLKPARDWFFAVRFIVPLWIIVAFTVIIGAIFIVVTKHWRNAVAEIKKERDE